jgi:hypothetical protein
MAVLATDVDGDSDADDVHGDDVNANESMVEDMVAGVLPVHATIGDVNPPVEKGLTTSIPVESP